MIRSAGLVLALLSAWLAVPAMAEQPHGDYTTVVKQDNQTDAQTDTTLWTPATGNKIVVLSLNLSADAAQDAFFEVTTTTKIQKLYVGAGGNASLTAGGRPVLVLATDEALTYTTSSGANTSVIAIGYETK